MKFKRAQSSLFKHLKSIFYCFSLQSKKFLQVDERTYTISYLRDLDRNGSH